MKSKESLSLNGGLSDMDIYSATNDFIIYAALLGIAGLFTYITSIWCS